MFALTKVALAMAAGLRSHCWVGDAESQSCRHHIGHSITFTKLHPHPFLVKLHWR